MQRKKIKTRYKIDGIDNGWYELSSLKPFEGWYVQATCGSLKIARLLKRALIAEEKRNGR
jgi:hypothetical protein